MKKRNLFLLLVIGVPLYYWLAYPSYTYRYRMTVEIDTPEGVKSGSSVIEVHTIQWPEWLSGLSGGHTTQTTVRGEAVFVDLEKQGMLFTALRWPNGKTDYASLILRDVLPISPPPKEGYDTPQAAKYYANLKSERTELKPEQFPLLVRFRNIDNPKTVEAVDPYKFSIIFGEGTSVKAITIEMTEDPITYNIDRHLKWLSKLSGSYLHGGSTSRDAPLGLHGGDFQIFKNRNKH